MRAEILSSPPLSGEYEEHSFSETNDCVWIKFVDQNFVEWVGVFDNAYGTSLKSVLQTKNDNSIIVIINGQGYSVDLNLRTISKKEDWQYIENIVYNQTTNLYLASNSLGLMVLDESACLWSSERISIDGITFTNQHGSTVDGYLNDLSEEGVKFSFDIETRELMSEWLFNDSINVEQNSNNFTTIVITVLLLIPVTLYVLFA